MTTPEVDAAYGRTVRELSDRIVTAQKPIRVLDAIKWDAGVEEAFFAAGGKEHSSFQAELTKDAEEIPLEVTLPEGEGVYELAATDGLLRVHFDPQGRVRYAPRLRIRGLETATSGRTRTGRFCPLFHAISTAN